MKRRCDQVTGKEPNCRDESDENGCRLISLKNNYNKNIPPIGSAKDGGMIPAKVSISIILMKIVEIEEIDHAIHFQFQIILNWRENRVKFHNLKEKVSLNALSENDIENLWLPLVIYDNTDQKTSTRQGWLTEEWVTRISVAREGKFKRSGLEEVDEIYIFEGSENNLTMTQTYTREFQCPYMLQNYPFDTQVHNCAGSRAFPKIRLCICISICMLNKCTTLISCQTSDFDQEFFFYHFFIRSATS